MKIQNFKMVMDILLTVALLLLMPYELVGEAAHEWIGIGMFVILIMHHALNRKWIGHMGKGNYTPVRMLQTMLVCLLAISILGSMISGILLSRHVFAFLNIGRISIFAERIHMVCAYWGFVLMSLHLGIHWQRITAAGKQLLKSNGGKPRYTQIGPLRLLSVAVAFYGLYAFEKRNFADYLFLQVHFVFFDYTDPLLFYMMDYAAVMGMLIFFGYYLNKGLCSIYQKVHAG